ncbi:hypothetical protein K2173_010376 [Erythroxylum novogranatense]|uniref:Dof zinc finger protein n=1 Tax=Erythroxylum novogranatense TaxID=1862640 RepID=A0AAV8TEQ4_9ROSI|nr:hypothetical protein K2173_010376 [Erythroxylum novogranatense]
MMPLNFSLLWEIVVKPIEEIATKTCRKASPSASERKKSPHKEQALNCPRCKSTNTKFCYYNNYSLTQPRYFCKTCRRYWTEGGSLRNIPVGGGSRKNKRSSSSSSKNLPAVVSPPSMSQSSTQNPRTPESKDLNLVFPSTQSFSELMQVRILENNYKNQISSPSSTSSTPQLSPLELLTGISSRGLNSFMPMLIQDPNTVYSTFGFPLQDSKPNLKFSLDGLGTASSGYEIVQGVQENSSGRLLFPFEDLKHLSSTNAIDRNADHGDSIGYWTGMLGGGTW